jgi:hypothetical protein
MVFGEVRGLGHVAIVVKGSLFSNIYIYIETNKILNFFRLR